MPADLRAVTIMRNNIRALLDARHESQAALASWLRHSRAWINKFLNGERQVQLKDLDRIADFFGIATYQLFQPGISPLTERRVQERRKRKDRRIGHAFRELERTREGLLMRKPHRVLKCDPPVLRADRTAKDK